MCTHWGRGGGLTVLTWPSIDPAAIVSHGRMRHIREGGVLTR